MTYVPRTAQRFLKTAVSQFPVVLITGARQVGKTTLLRHMMPKGMSYVTLDDPLVMDLARHDPALFLQRFPPPVLIDEIQYAPALLPHIKIAVDTKRKAGIFWLTGSQQFHLMKGVSESLAGRVGIVRLAGLSRREIQGQGAKSRPFPLDVASLKKHAITAGRLSLQELYHLVWRGTLPAIALNARIDRDLFFGSYVQTYLQRDVRDLARVGDEMRFLRFLRAAAARTGQLLNYTDLARDADISVNTAKSWLSILETSGIVYLLQPYHTNVSKRLVKAPKLYFLDTGLCAYLTQWSTPATLEAGSMSGAILETWILAELLKGYWHNGQEAPFYYYRDKDRKEIDLLIVADAVLYPLEFKKTASPDHSAVATFHSLERLRLPIGFGGVICLVEQLLPLTSSLWAIPVSAL